MATILLVDEDEGFLSTFSGAFFSPGVASSDQRIHLMVGHGVRESLEFLKHEHIDACIVALKMKPIDGMQFTRLVRQKYPQIRVILLAEELSRDEHEACVSVGADRVLNKPKDRDQAAELCRGLFALMAEEQPIRFTGQLPNISLHAAVRQLCHEGGSAVLEVRSGGTSGRVWIEDGALVHVAAGEQVGLPGLRSLLLLAGGEFTLQPFRDPGTRTLGLGEWEALVGLRSEAGSGADEIEGSDASGRLSRARRQDGSDAAVLDHTTTPADDGLSCQTTYPEAGVDLSEFVALDPSAEVLASRGSPDPELRADLVQFLGFRVQELRQKLGLGQAQSVHLVGQTYQGGVWFGRTHQAIGFVFSTHGESLVGEAEMIQAVRRALDADGGDGSSRNEA